MVLLDIRNLCVDLRTPDRGWITICKNLDLSLNEGEICGLIGDSGSGKSIIARAIVGMYGSSYRVSFDRFRFDKLDLTTTPLGERRRLLSESIAFIFQEANASLDPNMTIYEQMKEALPSSAFTEKWYRRPFWKKRTINTLLHKVGIKAPEKILKLYPYELSEVLCKKIVIAMALGRKPRLLIADEPIANMTTVSQLQILRLIASFNQNSRTTVLYICNDIIPVGNLLDRIQVIYGGQIIESNTTSQILSAPHHPYTCSMLDTIACYLSQSKKTRLHVLPGEPPELGHLPKGCALGPRCPYADKACIKAPPIIKCKGGSVMCRFPRNMENSND